MSSDEQSDKECPLCMEAFDFDDVHFYPCNCNYQICRFCWHRLRTDENGLCPMCRQPYPEDPVNFQPLSTAEIQKIKTEKRQKQQKNKQTDGKKPNPGLAAYRVLQKNLVYVIGLSQRMADSETLKRNEFFGKFGKILKVAVGTAQNCNNIQPISYTAYVTYGKTDDALRAIQTVNNLVVDGRLIKASLGTTKYCSNFLKGQACHKQECMYLHDVADDELSFTKEDMHQGKHTECERRLHEQMLSNQAALNPTTTQTVTPKSSSMFLYEVADDELSFTKDDGTQEEAKEAAECQRLIHEQIINDDVDLSPPDMESLAPSQSSMYLYDDLGFDPFSESSKALADMLEEEKMTFEK